MTLQILMLCPKAFTSGRTGGGERYSSEVAAALSLRPDVSLHVVWGTGYHSLLHQPPNSLDALPISFRSLVGQARAADILYVHQLNSHVMDMALCLSRWARRPVVLTDLGGGWKTVGRGFGQARLGLISGLAALSETSIDDLGWQRHRPHAVLYGGGDHILNTAHSARAEQFDFVFVGRLLPHKGAALLIDALPEGARCLVVGPTFGHHYQDLRERARGKDVSFNINVSDDGVAAAYRSARWAISPTMAVLGGKRLKRPELLGLSAIEAITLGTPVVLSDIPAFRELAPLVNARLFDADSEISLREALLWCQTQDPSRVVTEVARNFFRWSRVADKLIGVFEAVA